MTDLGVAFRSLDPHKFELLVTALLKARHPTLDIKHVNGEAGDQGLDIFAGDLDKKPVIWQCKSFKNGLGDSQKQKIRESLNTALKHYAPGKWVLCLNVDLDAKTHRWWQKFTESHAKESAVELQLWQANDILQQLLYHDTIRDQFLPGQALNVNTIKQALSGTTLFSDVDLADLSEQNAKLFLARLEAHDARFSYSVTYGRNQPQTTRPQSGSFLTCASDGATIHIGARDHEALRLNPPKVKFTAQGSGVEKLLEFHRNGKPTSLTSQEIKTLSSDFDFLMPPNSTVSELHLKASESQPTIPLRIAFGKGDGRITYEYVQFRRLYGGTQETTFENTTPLPFQVVLVIRTNGTGTVNFQDASNGWSVQDALRMVRAIQAAIDSGSVDFYDLSHGQMFFVATLTGTHSEGMKEFEQFLQETALVSDKYSVTLKLPEAITPEDYRSIVFLRELEEGNATASGSMSFTLVKKDNYPSDRLTDEVAVRVILPELPQMICVFGERIMTGPLLYEVQRGRFRNLAVVREFYKSESIGSSIDLTLDPVGEISIRRLKPGENVIG